VCVWEREWEGEWEGERERECCIGSDANITPSVPICKHILPLRKKCFDIGTERALIRVYN